MCTHFRNVGFARENSFGVVSIVSPRVEPLCIHFWLILDSFLLSSLDILALYLIICYIYVPRYNFRTNWPPIFFEILESRSMSTGQMF